jgi:hypothetical protein
MHDCISNTHNNSVVSSTYIRSPVFLLRAYLVASKDVDTIRLPTACTPYGLTCFSERRPRHEHHTENQRLNVHKQLYTAQVTHRRVNQNNKQIQSPTKQETTHTSSKLLSNCNIEKDVDTSLETPKFLQILM